MTDIEETVRAFVGLGLRLLFGIPAWAAFIWAAFWMKSWLI